MMKKITGIAMAAALMSIVACSGDSNSQGDAAVVEQPATNPPVAAPPAMNTPDQNNTEQSTAGENNNVTPPPSSNGSNPSGAINGVWFGNTGFGMGRENDVVIINENNDLFALSDNGDINFETAFGMANGELSRFLHRDSIDPMFADSFTISGDLPMGVDGSSNTITYNLSTANEGLSLLNSNNDEFAMTFAGDADIMPISVANIAGTWQAQTSFGDPANPIIFEVNLEISADGTLSGSSVFGEFVTPISGTVSASSISNLFVNVEFLFGTANRIGVMFNDRLSDKLVLNSSGPDGEVVASFSGTFVRQ